MTTSNAGLLDIAEAFGGIDVYLFDQLQRGVLRPDMRFLDAGCGRGRNLHYLIRSGADVWAVDRDPAAIERFVKDAAKLRSDFSPTRARVAELDRLPFPDKHFDAVLCSAVLHFARDEAHFRGMLVELWRVLAPGGVFFSRLGSTIGVEDVVTQVRGRRYQLPNGPEWFLVDRALLESSRESLGAQQLDPIKTTNVEDRRAMTTWVLGKPRSEA